MIFYTDNNAFESEKERNFYYKIFAGYIFNELIDEYETRINRFIDLLNKPRFPLHNKFGIPHLETKSVRVSFDNHVYLIKDTHEDKGEFADILIQDIHNKVLIPIEAKLFSDWSYEKDIKENTIRHTIVGDKMNNNSIYPVLLISANKWKSSLSLQNHPSSNYSRLFNDPATNFRVVCWEDILEILVDQRVRKFAEMILKSKSPEEMRLTIEDGWFKKID